MTILAVDDEPQFRLLIRDYLSTQGWDVLLAENGEEALRKMATVKVDFILSDVYMPVMNGITLHSTVRKIPGYERTPFLFISAHRDEHTINAIKDPMIEGFAMKSNGVSRIKEWILYLSSPEGKRSGRPL